MILLSVAAVRCVECVSVCCVNLKNVCEMRMCVIRMNE